ncbi:MAG: sugar transferase [Caldilineaceae bacterium]
MQLQLSSKPTFVDAARRMVDILVTLCGITLLLPVLLVLAVWILGDSRGPVFYRATRVGRYGMPFHLYKFRTMVVNADQVGPGITTAQDKRITRSGRFLRRTKLDELPQLINVLMGDMSLVGPRPEDPRYVALYTKEQQQILSVPPGITSAASLTYRHEEQLLAGPDWQAQYLQTVMPTKIAIDLEYEAHRTLWSDFKLVLRTVMAMFA